MRTLTSSLPGNRSLLKKVFRFAVMVALTFVPAGMAARVLGVVGKGPLRYVLALLLEPLFKRILIALFGRYATESNEKTTKRV
ncbi:phage shock protein PspD [Ewingella americana]|uniref:phage shock protein PspD n=1 Tax=Ewingella americana TaxID=41202 RepID=UPI0012AE8114|nr:phage shock protein PspD [Ewingella americana]MRT02944.1 phage shock protein D [Ewingella americana]